MDNASDYGLLFIIVIILGFASCNQNSTIDDLNSKIEDLESQVYSLEHEFGDLESRVDDLEWK